jgi:hypothetical protein
MPNDVTNVTITSLTRVSQGVYKVDGTWTALGNPGLPTICVQDRMSANGGTPNSWRQRSPTMSFTGTDGNGNAYGTFTHQQTVPNADDPQPTEVQGWGYGYAHQSSHEADSSIESINTWVSGGGGWEG